VYAAIASAVLQDRARDRKRDDLGEEADDFKHQCAQQQKYYDSGIAQKALAAARVARDRKKAEFAAQLSRRHP
jgi:hypothetical protein